MQANSDFEEMLRAFNDAGVKFLVVGAYAVAAYTRPRATGDIDLWVEVDGENARRVVEALRRFGAPLRGVTAQTFCEPEIVFQIGIAPVRIDIMTGIDGISFAEAWAERVATKVGEVPVYVIGREGLIRNKRASGRPQDLADLALLEREIE